MVTGRRHPCEVEDPRGRHRGRTVGPERAQPYEDPRSGLVASARDMMPQLLEADSLRSCEMDH